MATPAVIPTDPRILRHGTAWQWTASNLVLRDAEMGFEINTGKVKIGRSNLSWGSLPYFTGLKGDPGQAGAAGATGPAGAVGGAVSIVATATFEAFSAVTSSGTQGNSSTLAHYGKIVGVNPSTATSGFAFNVQQAGEVTNPSWTWTVGDVIFLNGATLSKVAPSTGFSQVVGIAKSATVIVVELGDPVLL